MENLFEKTQRIANRFCLFRWGPGRVVNSLFHFSLFALKKRASVRESLSSLFKKVGPWANRSCGSLQKRDRERIALIALYNRASGVIRSWFKQIALKIERFSRKNSYFSYVFDSFSLPFPFYMPKSELLRLLSKKERPWANHSHPSYKKCDCERIPFEAIYKRATVSESHSSLFKKEQHDLSKSLSKTSNSLKEIHIFHIFLTVFTAFPLFYAQ